MQKYKKSLLIVLSKAPYGSSNMQEAMDIVLAAGTFDQDVKLLICADACYLLLASQRGGSIQQKNISKVLQALPVYGIEEIFVAQDDASERKLGALETSLPLRYLELPAIADLYQQADTVIRF